MSTALLYSGGKDSSACLELLRPNWPELLVVSWRPKDMHADVADRLERVAAVVPHFVSVFSYPESWIAEHGYPSNIVPVPSCSAGRRLGFEPSVRISPWTDCCAANFWGPIYSQLRALGVTQVITGVKACDGPHGSATEPGKRWGPFTFHAPVWEWSDADVEAYLVDKEFGMLPRYTAGCLGSTACRFCTANIRGEGPSTWAWMRDHDPEGHKIVTERLRQIKRAVLDEI